MCEKLSIYILVVYHETEDKKFSIYIFVVYHVTEAFQSEIEGYDCGQLYHANV